LYKVTPRPRNGICSARLGRLGKTRARLDKTRQSHVKFIPNFICLRSFLRRKGGPIVWSDTSTFALEGGLPDFDNRKVNWFPNKRNLQMCDLINKRHLPALALLPISNSVSCLASIALTNSNSVSCLASIALTNSCAITTPF
jgi:hypothetical protein